MRKKRKPNAPDVSRLNWPILLSIISTVCSLIALGTSIRSCVNFNKSLEMAESEFTASRSVIYKGTLKEDNQEIILSSQDSSIQLQSARIFLPPQLDKSEWIVSPPRYGFPLVMLRSEIEEFIKATVKPSEGYTTVLDQTSVPIIIGSNYVAKGESYTDFSLYLVQYEAIVSDRKFVDPKVDFKGLLFIKHLSKNSKPYEILNGLWGNELHRKTS